jgi:hypothetical protein
LYADLSNPDARRQLGAREHSANLWLSAVPAFHPKVDPSGEAIRALREVVLLQTKEVGRNLSYQCQDGQRVKLAPSVLPSSPRLIPNSSVQKGHITVVGVVDKDVFTCARAQIERNLNTCVIMEASLGPTGNNTCELSYAMESTALAASCSSLYHLHQQAQAAPKEGVMTYASQVVVFRSAEEGGYSMLAQPFRTALCSVPFAVEPPLMKRHTTGIGKRWRYKPQFEHVARELLRAVFRTALHFGHDALVLPALGCGPLHHHPPGHVSELIAAVLKEMEFSGRFKEVLIAVPHEPALPHHPTLSRNRLQLKLACPGGVGIGEDAGEENDYSERDDEMRTIFECFETCFEQVGLDGITKGPPRKAKVMSEYDQMTCQLEKLTYQ